MGALSVDSPGREDGGRGNMCKSLRANWPVTPVDFRLPVKMSKWWIPSWGECVEQCACREEPSRREIAHCQQKHSPAS